MSTKRKIILFFSSLENGGGRTFAISFVKLMENYDVFLATIRNQRETSELAESLGVKTIDVLSLAALLDESVLLISNSQICALIGSIFYSGRHYYVTHGFANGLPFINRIRASSWKLQVKFLGSKLIACGDSEYQAIESILGDSNRVALVRNSSIDEKYLENIDHVRKRRGATIDLLFIGRISFQKGLDVLLRALIILQKTSDVSKITLTVIGPVQSDEGTYYSDISDLVSELIVETRLMPAQVITRDLFDRYDALVMPSRFEGLPYLLLEAANSMIPVIVSNCNGCNDVVLNEKQGHIFLNGNADSLAGAISRFIDSPEVTNEERAIALKTRVSQFYSAEAFLKGYDRLLSE